MFAIIFVDGGAGFVLALSKRWKQPEEQYRSLKPIEHQLGNVQFVAVEHNISVVNMIAQHGIGKDKDGLPPIRYWALRDCLIKVNDHAVKHNATLHCPRFGAGLSGGSWDMIEQIIKETITVDVYVYDLK